MAEPEDTAAEETEEAAPEKTAYIQSAESYKLPSLSELKEGAQEIGRDVVDRVGEETVEIFTQPARATADNVMARIRNGIRGFLAPIAAPPTCEHTTKTGNVCGRPEPCVYPSHRSDE